MDIPAPFARFDCADYFASTFAATGHWCQLSQSWVVVPHGDVCELHAPDGSSLDFLRIGDAGSDGIAFGYRAGFRGLWAHYPIERDHTLVAPNITEFVRAWDADEVIL